MEAISGKPVFCRIAIVLALLPGLTACVTPRSPLPALPVARATATPVPIPPTLAPGRQITLIPTSPSVPEVTAAPAPTAAPDERLSQAAAQEGNGNYAVAMALLQALVDSDAATEIRREALWRLVDSQLQASAYPQAAASARRYLDAYPEDPKAPTVCYWLGESLAAQGDGQGAAAAYRDYLDRNPLLDAFVQERIGDALARAGDHAGAAVAYRAAADGAASASDRVGRLEGLAHSLRALQRYDQAVAAYDEILSVARIDAYRAEIMHEAGATLREAGRTGEAAARWNQLVATYPESAYAAEDLPLLDAWGLAEADALTRARVDYAAGRYAEALSTLQRELERNPQGHESSAHYYAALSYRGLGQHRDSLGELDHLIQAHPQSSLMPEAWYQKGESLALLGSIDAAVAAFQGLAAQYPAHARSAPALVRAAQVLNGAGRSWDASAAYRSAAVAYPGAQYASDARFRAGLVHYLNRAAETAARTWADLLPQEKDPAMRARLLLWLGKAASDLGDQAGAHQRWAEAEAADPQGFWGLRARDLLAGRSFAGRAPAGAFASARYAPRGDRAEAEAWLAGWAGAPPEQAGKLPAPVAEAPGLRLGLELWHLGEGAAATTELRQVVDGAKGNPWTLYALALYLRDQGLYLFSTSLAERILGMAPAEARRTSPRFLEEMAYPTYYADLVLKEAQPTNTDPLLFFALMRQESYFDRYATSRSDARGLAQVIPSTGSYIAGRLGDAAYSDERLWWPAVGVRYGLWYLSSALKMFGDDAVMALAAYNAGPGNASKWQKLARGDPDLFYEQATSAQARSYMRRIYEHRAHYERLYH